MWGAVGSLVAIGLVAPATAAAASRPQATHPITTATSVRLSGTVSGSRSISGCATIRPGPTRPLTPSCGVVTVTVTASGTYGSSPSLSGLLPSNSAIAYNPTSEKANITGTLTCSTSATSSSTVAGGPYTISGCSGLSDTFHPIAYDYVHSSYSVTQASLTVTAVDADTTYGGAMPAFGFNTTGFVLSQDASSLSTQPVCTTTAASVSGIDTSAVALYAINCNGAAAANYQISYVAGTFTVSPTPLTFTPDDQQVVYGSSMPTFTFTGNGFVLGEDASALATPPSCTSTADTNNGNDASPPAQYDITCSGAASPNYDISYAASPGTLTVSAAPLTITPDDQNVAYGGAMPTFTFTGNGFVNGDDASLLETQPTCGTTATSTAGNDTSPVGTYDITCSGGVSENYDISYAATPGTLTVSNAVLTVTAYNKSQTYGGTMPTFTSSVTGFVNGDNARVLTTKPTCTTTALSSSGKGTSGFGTYPITCNGAAANGNYSVNYVAGTFTVYRTPLVVTADDQNVNYGATMPTFTYSINGFVNGEDSSALTALPVCTSKARTRAGNEASGVGSYAITCRGAADPNYSISYVPGTLYVQPVLLTITAYNKSTTYGGAMPTFTYSASGFVNGDGLGSLPVKPVCSTTAQSNLGLDTSGFGTYEIDCNASAGPGFIGRWLAGPLQARPNTVAADGNYDLSYSPGTFNVFKAKVLITADDQVVNVGDPMPTFTFTGSGFMNGEDVSVLSPHPVCKTTVKNTSTPGLYAITCRGAGSPNYAISYAAGSLSIN
jgi:hypothetical protein